MLDIAIIEERNRRERIKRSERRERPLLERPENAPAPAPKQGEPNPPEGSTVIHIQIA